MKILSTTITIATFLLGAAAQRPVGGHNIVEHKHALGERDTRVATTNVVQHNNLRVASSSDKKKVTAVVHKKYVTDKSKDSRSTTSKSSKSKSSKNKKKKKKKCNKNKKCNNNKKKKKSNNKKKKKKKNSVKKVTGLITFETHSLESNDGTVYTLASCFATLATLQIIIMLMC